MIRTYLKGVGRGGPFVIKREGLERTSTEEEGMEQKDNEDYYLEEMWVNS